MGLTAVRLAGVAAAPGVARGPWIHVRRRELPVDGRVAPGAVEAEAARLHDAANAAADDLMALSERVGAEGHEDEAAIFIAHAAMAWDPMLVEGAASRIRRTGRMASPRSWPRVRRPRASSRRSTTRCSPRGPRTCSTSRTGSRASSPASRPTRYADRAGDRRRRGPPAVDDRDAAARAYPGHRARGRLAHRPCRDPRPGLRDPGGGRRCGTPSRDWPPRGPDAELVLDGATGEVVVAPDPETGAEFDAAPPATRSAAPPMRRRRRCPPSQPTVSRSRCSRTSARRREAGPARALGAHGVGLFRTEFLFLERSTPPTEDEQAAAYREAVEAFGGDPVTIRLLDIGGDKPIPYLPLPAEENPFLGVRALRLAQTARSCSSPSSARATGRRSRAR